MTAQEYFGDWFSLIDMNVLDSLMKQLHNRRNFCRIFPDTDSIFKAFRMCSLENTKVVFLFQDPYPQPDVATGIALANNADRETLSPSLKVVKNSVKHLAEPENTFNFDPTLESWEKQGVLMLNAALTVEEGKAGSHCLFWRQFIIHLLKSIVSYNNEIIFVLFGLYARDFKHYIENAKYVYEMKHPSYYARIKTDMPCDIFCTVNEILASTNRQQIKWYN